jgi:hypothetical protein
MWWIFSNICMLVEPLALRSMFERRFIPYLKQDCPHLLHRHRLYHILPATIATVSILVLLQTHAAREDKIIVFVKGMSFACLSLAWIYIKGIHQVLEIELMYGIPPDKQVILSYPHLPASPYKLPAPTRKLF